MPDIKPFVSSNVHQKQALRALTAAWGVRNGDAPLSRLEQIGATSRKHVCLFCSQFFRPDAADTAVAAKQAQGYTPFVDHTFDPLTSISTAKVPKNGIRNMQPAVKLRTKGKKRKKLKKRTKLRTVRYCMTYV
jgi:hypothetical protein